MRAEFTTSDCPASATGIDDDAALASTCAPAPRRITYSRSISGIAPTSPNNARRRQRSMRDDDQNARHWPRHGIDDASMMQCLQMSFSIM